MHNSEKYRITFHGVIVEDEKVETVKAKMASLFGIHVSTLDPIFSGKFYFQRRDLNKITAELYRDKFNKIGAVCRLEKYNEKDAEVNVTNTYVEKTESTSSIICPKCYSTNIDKNKCHDCGIFFEKYNSINSNNTQDDVGTGFRSGNNIDADNDNSDLVEVKRKAILIIKYALYYIIAVFAVDSYIDSNREALKYIISSDFKVGFIPYLIGNVALAYGCFYLAKSKDRSGFWGLFGLINLPGFCVLLLLQDKNNPASRIDIKIQIASYAVIVLSIIWVGTKYFVAGKEDDYIAKGTYLRELRHEYPSSQIDSINSLYRAEISELNNYLDEGFNLLSESSFNHYQITAISDAMFSETFRIFVWVKYQQYLQFRNGGGGIEFLDIENIRELQKITFTRILKQVQKNGSTSLYNAFERWFFGSAVDYEKLMFFSQFQNKEFEIGQHVRELEYLNKLPFEQPEFSIKNIKIPKFPKNIIVNVTVDERSQDIISYTFSSRSYSASDKVLVLAYYYAPYQSYDITARSTVDKYILKTAQISPDFPGYIIHGDIGVFDARDIAPIFAQFKMKNN